MLSWAVCFQSVLAVTRQSVLVVTVKSILAVTNQSVLAASNQSVLLVTGHSVLAVTRKSVLAVTGQSVLTVSDQSVLAFKIYVYLKVMSSYFLYFVNHYLDSSGAAGLEVSSIKYKGRLKYLYRGIHLLRLTNLRRRLQKKKV